MQFLWKYIDEILGKGLSIFDLLELIFYYAVTLIPMAVPITVLISSVMVFGDMAEKHELSSMKSAGVSLTRIMLSGVIISLGIGLFSILASNFLKPAALLQFNKRFITIRKQKSALSIEEGIFNNAFNETIIRVDKIDKDKKTIHDVLIYDHNQNDKSLIGVTTAKSGEMFTVDNGRYFVMELDTGINYQELERRNSTTTGHKEMPFTRTYFDKWEMAFDMNEFSGEEGLLNFNRDREQMMNSSQLIEAIDSISGQITKNHTRISDRLDDIVALRQENEEINTPDHQHIKVKPQVLQDTALSAQTLKDSIHHVTDNAELNTTEKTDYVSFIKSVSGEKQDGSPIPIVKKVYNETQQGGKRIIRQDQNATHSKLRHIINSIHPDEYRLVLGGAQSMLSRDWDNGLSVSNSNQEYSRQKNKYLLRLNQQYSWAVVCILFLFIGAPLGSIIRKGGYGYPLLVAILFYMMFIISTIYGEKLVRSDAMSGIMAAWVPCIILAPWSILLTFMALRDTGFNPASLYGYVTGWAAKIKRLRTTKATGA